MGLLEKALEYKKEINRRGKATLIDTIKGPAETEMMDDEIPAGMVEEISADISVHEDSDEDISDDLFELPEDDNYSPLDALKGQKAEADHDYDEIKPKISTKDTEETPPVVEDIPDPLTAEDEPMLPKDFGAAVKSDGIKSLFADEENHNMDTIPGTEREKEEILEIDPYIISEHNAGTEAGLPREPLIKSIDEINENETKLKDKIDIGSMPDKKYQEHMTLYEICKEISKSETKKSLFEVVIFSVMGQVGTSAASIMIKSPENDKWVIVNSSGLKSTGRTPFFDASAGILKNIKKDIIDIERFKDDPDYSEDYKLLSSTGARILIPWYFKGRVLGILALGNKITDDDYTAEEKDFIQAVCEASAIELNKISSIEKLKSESETSKTDLNFLQYINDVQEKIITKSSLREIKDIIKSEFEKLGIISFSVFINDPAQGKYMPVITSQKEAYKSGIIIDETNHFVSFIKKRKASPRIEDFNKLEIIKKAFNETEIKKMSVLWIYPLVTGDQLTGFTAVFNVKDELLNEDKKSELDNNLDKFSKMVLLNIMNIIHIDPDENRHIDNIERIFNRINSELANSKRLNIPLALVIFSIKNYKRYGNVSGYAKAKELIDNFSGLIKSRLSETDFSARYDRNKILIALPGKDKRFASHFANTIKNGFMQGFKKNEMQLLITFLISEYPEDGDNLLSLIDSID